MTSARPDVLNYIQIGHPEFESQHPALRDHMRAAARIAAAPPLPDHDTVGFLDPERAIILWGLATQGGSIWNLSPYWSLPMDDFIAFTMTKSVQAPSYFTAYRYAYDMFINLARATSPSAAATYMYTPNPPDPPPNWDVVRAWVIKEFLMLGMSVAGGFRGYGWALQPGFPGGAYNVLPCPYRTLPDGE